MSIWAEIFLGVIAVATLAIAIVLVGVVVAASRLARRVGKRLPVLIDRVTDGIAYGRTAGDAPEIDGIVRIKASAQTRPGEFVQATIVAADTYDLEGRL